MHTRTGRLGAGSYGDMFKCSAVITAEATILNKLLSADTTDVLLATSPEDGSVPELPCLTAKATADCVAAACELTAVVLSDSKHCLHAKRMVSRLLGSWLFWR